MILSLLFVSGCNKNDSIIDVSRDDVSNVSNVGSICNNVDKQLLLPNVKKIVDRGYIKVAMLADDIDVFCRTQPDKSLAGLDVDMAQNIADVLGVSLVIDQTAKAYDDIIKLLSTNDVDLGVAMYSIDTTRAACLALSDPYLVSNLCIMINKKELAKNGISKNPIDYMKQNKIKVAVLKGSVHVRAVKRAFPDVEVVEMNTQDEIRNSVMNDEVFGCFSGQVESLCDYIQYPELSIYTKSFVFSDESDKFCIAIPPNNIDMLNFINAYINSSRVLNIDDVEQACKNLYKY